MSERVRWIPAYVGIGSNLDEPLEQVRTAIAALARLPQSRLISISAGYRSRPMGPADQPDYINAAAGLLTRLDPRALLAELLRIERAMGRERGGQRWGPRRIDLDLLVHGNSAEDSDALVLPHAGVHERSFVLYPLADIAPAMNIAGRGRVDALVAACPDDDLQRLGDSLIP